MYSIHKILAGLKLTFILIISFAGIYLLETNARKQWMQPPDPVSIMHVADIIVTEPENHLVEKIPAAGKVPAIIKPDPVGSGNIGTPVHSLSDLGLHIEL